MAKETEQKKEKEQSPAMAVVQDALKSKDALIEKQGQVLSHPQVQELLQKLNDGKEVTIGEKVEEESKEKQLKEMLSKSPDEVPQKAEDWDALSNQQLAEILGKTVEGYIDTVRQSEATAYQAEFAKMKDELVTTQQSILNLAAQNEVKAFQKQNPDFEQYRDKMQEVVKRIPGINVQDAYDLVKGKHMASVPGADETFSERPESSSSVPTWEPPHLRVADSKTDESAGTRTAGASRSGSRDFMGIARQALAKTQLQSSRRA